MSGDGLNGLLFSILLSLQFGLQPMLTSRFTAEGVSKSSMIIASEFGKILIASLSLLTENIEIRRKLYYNWNLLESLRLAMIPALTFTLQNHLLQNGYALIDSVTFNLLNQAKVRLHPRSSFLC